jgi:hypothetical protein
MPAPPHNLQILKGCKNVALTRDDAKKFLTSELALTLYNWIIHLLIPDESFFSTLASVDVLENGTVVQDLTKNTTHGLVSQCMHDVMDQTCQTGGPQAACGPIAYLWRPAVIFSDF